MQSTVEYQAIPSTTTAELECSFDRSCSSRSSSSSPTRKSKTSRKASRRQKPAQQAQRKRSIEEILQHFAAAAKACIAEWTETRQQQRQNAQGTFEFTPLLNSPLSKSKKSKKRTSSSKSGSKRASKRTKAIIDLMTTIPPTPVSSPVVSPWIPKEEQEESSPIVISAPDELPTLPLTESIEIPAPQQHHQSEEEETPQGGQVYLAEEEEEKREEHERSNEHCYYDADNDRSEEDMDLYVQVFGDAPDEDTGYITQEIESDSDCERQKDGLVLVDSTANAKYTDSYIGFYETFRRNPISLSC